VHPELRRVDVDADNDRGVGCRGLADEGQVAGVQGSHGGHETDGAVVEELFAPPLAQGGNLAEHFDGGVGNGGACLALGQLGGGREVSWIELEQGSAAAGHSSKKLPW